MAGSSCVKLKVQLNFSCQQPVQVRRQLFIALRNFGERIFELSIFAFEQQDSLVGVSFTLPHRHSHLLGQLCSPKLEEDGEFELGVVIESDTPVGETFRDQCVYLGAVLEVFA